MGKGYFFFFSKISSGVRRTGWVMKRRERHVLLVIFSGYSVEMI